MKRNEVIRYLRSLGQKDYTQLIKDVESCETGYEVVKYKLPYWYENDTGGIVNTVECGNSERGLYECGNYYSDYSVAINNIRVNTLLRKLRRFAAQHGGCCPPNQSGNLYYITYNYADEALNVSFHDEQDNFNIGEPLFATEEAAQAAINEFADELVWYFTEYSPMPDEYV